MKKILNKIFFPWRCIQNIHSLFTRKEKILLTVLAVCFFTLGIFQINNYLNKNSTILPKEGGTYSEILVGEMRYPLPILSLNYVDATVDSLIYSGLTYLSKEGTAKPLLAEGWQTQEDGRRYNFKLKKNIYWHDGIPFTAKDVDFTVKSIQDPTNQSPHIESWKDVKVAIPDDYTVEFYLPEKNAPFLSSTTIGIIPAHISVKENTKRMIGTGPYKLDTINIDEQGAIKELVLKSNENYFLQKPWISSVKFILTDSPATALEETKK